MLLPMTSMRYLKPILISMKTKITRLRLNEAGDFRNQKEIKKWNKIAGRLKREHGIVTYTYTARSDLDFSKAPNIVVNGSNPGIRGAVREFRCVEPEEFDNMKPSKGEYKCPFDCTKCSVCASRHFKGVIYCRRH